MGDSILPFANYDQIVIYGAKGWIGRSALDSLIDNAFAENKSKLVLIGSKTESSQKAGLPVDVFTSEEADSMIKDGALFLNAAYLRREKLSELGENNYRFLNEKITAFPSKVLESGRVKTFINLSSGVAKMYDNQIPRPTNDPYAKLKKDHELLFGRICESTKTQLINCRIYNITGRHINEFKNLALSSFIAQSQSKTRKIIIQSPRTLRTYIDAVDLMKVIFGLANSGRDMNLDSGGNLISLEELARSVSVLQEGTSLEILANTEQSPDYYGDFSTFNKIAADYGINLKNIEEQIMETLEGFKIPDN